MFVRLTGRRGKFSAGKKLVIDFALCSGATSLGLDRYVMCGQSNGGSVNRYSNENTRERQSD
jgi:hypothetical protein